MANLGVQLLKFNINEMFVFVCPKTDALCSGSIQIKNILLQNLEFIRQ